MRWPATVAGIGLIVGAWVGPARAQARRHSPDPGEVYAVPLGASPRLGKKATKVTLVYACDYLSPFCERIRPTFEQLRTDYGDDLAIVHKHVIVHEPKARPPALAACAAHRQGKFWEMDALIWERLWPARDYTEDKLKALADELGLDRKRFERDTTRTCPKIIDAERKEMNRFGVSGVPASFINGRFLSGAQPPDQFKALIDEELGKASGRIKNKGQLKGYYAKHVIKAGKKRAPVDDPPDRLDPLKRARPDPAAVYAVEVAGSPSTGPAHARVTMVIACEFGDVYCKKLRDLLDDLVARYGTDLKIVHKHFVVHPDRATTAALAACAAHRQGKYADMASLLWGQMADDRDYSKDRLAKAAGQIGLDMARFDSDVAGACEGIVKADQARMQDLGAVGIPTTYINGRYVSGAQPLAHFETLIDEELAKANQRLGKNGKVDRYYETWVVKQGKKTLRAD